MTDDTRLERIEARAKAIGLCCIISNGIWIELYEKRDTNADWEYGNYNLIAQCKGAHVAEALLSLYEAQVVVEIKRPCQGGPCHIDCDLLYEEYVCGDQYEDGGFKQSCAMGWADDNEPNADCPGPAPDGKEYVLVLREKVNDEQK
jgi:hypothetical protein